MPKVEFMKQDRLQTHLPLPVKPHREKYTMKATITSLTRITLLAIACLALAAGCNKKTVAEARFEISIDKTTVRDTATGLIWTRDADIGGQMTAQQAVEWVKTVRVGGATDWRLPTVEELNGIANTGQYQKGNCAFDSSKAKQEMIAKVAGTSPAGNLNTLGFTNVKADFYWSSERSPHGSYSFWVVEMGEGSKFSMPNSNEKHVWPVRSESTSPVASTR
ncbi:MAG: DUF1566 domain-containing protein [Verrucomicrobiota bacterium]